MFGGNYYFSAVLPRSDFDLLVLKLKLRNREDLLTFWRSAFLGKDISWWTVSSVNDSDTFFGDSEHDTYLVARYEAGRIFFKRHVY